ncbi:MAG: Ribosomal RNA small subunit methyltransferase H [candidate division TM6 bacterium GW2011_GWF2_38_10]|nr:MAG: Ribosomal RNA small subunit methyltransferase H [candidate division TM6 bacterium GW2011_GWF2_38_10]
MDKPQDDKKEFLHKSVLVQEVITYLAPCPGGMYIDATFGGGGHTRAILDAEPTCSVLALDWDNDAIKQNAPALEEQYGDRFSVVLGNFSHLYKIIKREKINHVDGILADFGTSQYQIHNKAGFSFLKNTPLDMRMSAGHYKETAADIINQASEQEIAHILFTYGEEHQAKKIARAIVKTRTATPFKTTGQLVDVINSVLPISHFKRQYGIHPATRTFQALRIVVNHELDNIHNFLKTGTGILSSQGRMVCISFHSLEDRIVKNYFRDNAHQYDILTPKPITATEEELALNPSSRSAKLRAAKKH